MEATQVKTEEAVQAPGKKEPPKLKVPKKKKKWLKRLIIAVVVLAAIFLIFIQVRNNTYVVFKVQLF